MVERFGILQYKGAIITTVDYFMHPSYQQVGSSEYYVHTPDRVIACKTFEDACSAIDKIENSKQFDSKMEKLLNE